MTGKKAEILDETIHQDGLENLIAQMGTGQDKRSHSTFSNSKQLSAQGNQTELNALYRTDWLSGKVVDIVPDDMTREWRSFTGDMEPEKVKILEDEENRLQLSFSFCQAHKWARLYGTSFIVMSVDDGQEPHMPLNIDAVKLGGLRYLNVIDRHRVSQADVQVNNNPLDANFGKPEFYRFNETSVKIHHSRVLRFDGIQLPYEEFRRNNYNSDSVLDRLYEAITDFNTTTTGAASMVYESNVDIMKIKGLANYLQTADGEANLRKRFTMASTMKSFNNMLILDSEEDHQTKTNSFSGLPDLLDRFAAFLSAASDIPATRLLGTSAAGLNATGEGDLKNYYDKIRSDQNREYKPTLDYFDKIMAKSLGINDEDLAYEFNSLFQMTPKETAEVGFLNAQRDAIYLDRDVVSEEIVAKDLKQSDTYANITDEHIEELEATDDDAFDTDTDAFENEPEEDPKEIKEGSTDKGSEK